MSGCLSKLEKILQLEKAQSFQNRAVIGGLEKFLAFWQKDALAEFPSPEKKELINEIISCLQGYAQQDQDSRAINVKKVLNLLSSDRATQPGHAKRKSQTAPPKTSRTERLARKKQNSHQTRLDSPVVQMRGISSIYAKRLQQLGINTIRDLLFHFPRRYNDFSTLKPISEIEYGEEVTIIGQIWETNNRVTRTGKNLTTSIISDGTATIEATWFNQPYLVKKLRPGREIILSGKVDAYLGRLVMSSPEWEPLEKESIHTGRIVPVYPQTEGVRSRWLRRVIKPALDHWAPRLVDALPAGLRQKARLLDLPTAIRQIHFPDSWEALEEARRRFCFEEFLLIQLGVLRQRRAWEAQQAIALQTDQKLLDHLFASLPFELTRAQRRAIQEIHADLQKPHPMSRLLQGDVGSGKTIVALTAILTTVNAGLQAVVMAPTEILAEQHYANFANILRSMTERADDQAAEFLSKLKLRLLTGSVRPATKEAIHDEIASGEANIIVGTHALIQETVNFDRLGLVVIDEQHRFGVIQRASLRRKTNARYQPHTLVMSATPIPRTLALTIYGDLDISVLDEMPPHRRQVITQCIPPRERERAYSFLRSQIENGHQAFIICPLVEESDKIEAKAAVEEYQRLQREIFPDLRLGLLHGRMKGADKDRIMEAFRNGELDILVSTAVVEVGIDVPNATVMLIEGADRFGLAQLHQFRGRVGRSEYQSYCLLLAENPSPEGAHRLQLMESTNDGFRLAEEDLKMRGPGEFFGTKQSGLPPLKVARLSDVHVLEEARAYAAEIFRDDPDLEKPEHQPLSKRLSEFWQGQGDLS